MGNPGPPPPTLLLPLQVRNAKAMRRSISRVRRWLSEDGLTAAEAAERLVDHAMRRSTNDNASNALLHFSTRPLTMQRAGVGMGAACYGSAAGGGEAGSQRGHVSAVSAPNSGQIMKYDPRTFVSERGAHSAWAANPPVDGPAGTTLVHQHTAER